MGKYIREFLVYALKRADGRPFYIGKGSRTRYANHLRLARNGGKSLRCKIIRRMIRNGETVGFEIIKRCDSAEEAFALERKLIAFYGREDRGTGILANHTDGGDGVSGHSEELKRRLSDLSRAAMTSQARAHLRDIATKQMADPEHRAKHSAAIKIAQNRPHALAANRARGLKQASDPGFSKRMSDAVKAYNATPEATAFRRAKAAALWADPAYREKILAAQAAGKAARRERLKNGGG